MLAGLNVVVVRDRSVRSTKFAHIGKFNNYFFISILRHLLENTCYETNIELQLNIEFCVP